MLDNIKIGMTKLSFNSKSKIRVSKLTIQFSSEIKLTLFIFMMDRPIKLKDESGDLICQYLKDLLQNILYSLCKTKENAKFYSKCLV